MSLLDVAEKTWPIAVQLVLIVGTLFKDRGRIDALENRLKTHKGDFSAKDHEELKVQVSEETRSTREMIARENASLKAMLEKRDLTQAANNEAMWKVLNEVQKTVYRIDGRLEAKE